MPSYRRKRARIVWADAYDQNLEIPYGRVKVKVTIDGKETEVELDDALYMTTEQHESGLKKEVEPLKQPLRAR